MVHDFDLDLMADALEGIPSPGMSPIRQAMAFSKDQYGFLDESWRELGDTFAWELPGEVPFIVLAHPEDIKKVFALRPESIFSGDLAFHGNLGERCLLFADGERHRQDRSLISPSLHGKLLESYGPNMLECMQSAVDAWEPGKTLRLQDELSDVTLQVIIRCVLGAEDARELEMRELVLKWVEELYAPWLHMVAAVWGLKRARLFLERKTDERFAGRRGWLPFPGRKSTGLKARFMHLLVDDIERCRASDVGGREDVLARVAAATYDDGEPMDVRTVIDQLTLLFSAGHETTAKSVGWVLRDVIERPELLARLRDELDERFGSGPLEPNACRTLPLLNSVIKESMRLTPVATGVSRKLLAPLELRGHTLAPGMIPSPSNYLAHRHPDYWGRPDEFIPERFIDNKPAPHVYFPFGGGRRRCLGATFAEFEMPILLAPILRRADLGFPAGVEIRPVFGGVTLGPSDGLPLEVGAVRPRA